MTTTDLCRQPGLLSLRLTGGTYHADWTVPRQDVTSPCSLAGATSPPRCSHTRRFGALTVRRGLFETCGRGEGVQDVLILFCSGAAQVVCHALRVEELREQLDVEEKDGDRQEKEVEVKGEANQRERTMLMTMDGDMKVLRT